MFTIKAELFSDCRCDLAEGPHWDERERTLYWLDIKRCQILSRRGDGPKGAPAHVVLDMAQNVGCMALRENGGMIMGLTTGIYLTGVDGGIIYVEAPGHSIRTRFNDGKCDALGRFWAGSINLFDGETQGAALYCVLAGLSIKRVLSGVTNSNGLAFSSDMRTMYYIDTPTRRVDAFDIFEGADGFPTLMNRRMVVNVAHEFGYPDGMTIDEAGRLWVACWGSGKVCCFDPKSGELLGFVDVPVKAASSCCFGGDDMRTLFITTAREGLLPGEEKLAGNVYKAALDVPGAPSYRFKG